MRNPIGPRWLAWILLAYGVLEIPWVIYLAFFQTRNAEAQHTHLAMLGLAGGGAVLSLLAAWLLWKRAAWSASLCVVTATWLGCALFFGVVISAVGTIWVTLPGIVAAALAASKALREQSPPPWIPLVLLAVAGVLLFHLGQVLNTDSTTLPADHLRLLVVVFDSAEVAALLGSGLSLRAGAPRAAIAFGSAGVVLFAMDAFINVVTVPAGPEFAAAILYAIVGEFPAVAMSVATVVLAMRRRQALTAKIGA